MRQSGAITRLNKDIKDLESKFNSFREQFQRDRAFAGEPKAEAVREASKPAAKEPALEPPAKAPELTPLQNKAGWVTRAGLHLRRIWYFRLIE